MSLNTKEVLEKNIKENLKYYISTEYMINILDPVLSEWENKQVNKRIVSHVTTNIGSDFHVYLDKTYFGIYQLHVSRGNKNLVVTLTSDKNNKKFSIDFFRQTNKWAYEMSEKIKKCENALNEINFFVLEFDRIKNEIDTLKIKMKEKGIEHTIEWKNLIY
jgi:hypothetical protein